MTKQRKRASGDDLARAARGQFVSTLPNSHQPTEYARAKVCARCGQRWPCEWELADLTGVNVMVS